MTSEGLGEMFEGDSADTWLVRAMEMAGKHSDHYFRRWQANIVTTINFFFEKNEKNEKYFEIFYPHPPRFWFFFEKKEKFLGKPSKKKTGNSLVFDQTGGGTPQPNYFPFFLGDFFLL